MHFTDSTPLQVALTALASNCFERACKLEHGSDLTVPNAVESIEANALRRTGMSILRARDCARGNES